MDGPAPVEQAVNAQASLVEVKTHFLEPAKMPALTRGAKVEEIFLDFCTTKLEEPEREGKLPREYSNLTLEELQKTIRGESVEVDDQNPDKALELDRLKETIDAHNKHRPVMATVHTEADTLNPLGEISDGTIVLIADDHEAPSYAAEGTRSQAFNRYSLERGATTLIDKISQLKRYGLRGNFITKNYTNETMPSDNVVKRYIDRTDSRRLFDSWFVDMVAKGQFREPGDTTSQPIIFHLGDRVHDGAFLLDQLDQESKYFQMMDEIVGKNPSLKLSLLEINGNHDQDARVPEATIMLDELFGQRLFIQEIGGVMIAAVDTNIENPVWVKQFIARTGDAGQELLNEKRKLQEAIIKAVETSEKPIIIIGHHPSRVVDSFAVKRQILQNSNIIGIIGGHTHYESHILTPIKNKNGKDIQMHVLESYSRTRDGKPTPVKAFTMRLNNGQTGQMRTLTEQEESFGKRYEEYLTVNNLD